jgi:hypothetical protein
MDSIVVPFVFMSCASNDWKGARLVNENIDHERVM